MSAEKDKDCAEGEKCATGTRVGTGENKPYLTKNVISVFSVKAFLFHLPFNFSPSLLCPFFPSWSLTLLEIPLPCLLIFCLLLCQRDCHRALCCVLCARMWTEQTVCTYSTKAALTSALANSSELPACNYPLVLLSVLSHSSSLGFPVCFLQSGFSPASLPHLELSLPLFLPHLQHFSPLPRPGKGVV